MGLAVFFLILLICAEIVENFAVWTTGVADRSGLDAAAAGPPVFFVVVEEDVFAWLNSPLVAIFGGADFGDLGVDAGFFEGFLPNLRGFGIFRNAVFFVADKASDVDATGVETDFFG